MNITLEKIGNVDAILKVEILESDYAEKVAKELKKYQRNAVIPGFRKGNAPFGMIKRAYGKSVLSDEVQSVLSENMYQYIQDNKIEIFGNPMMKEEQENEIDWDNQKDFLFCFEIGLRPDINIDFKSVTATRYSVEADPEQIETYKKEISQRYGRFESPDIAENGDMLYGEIQELDASDNAKEEGIKTFTTIVIDSMKTPSLFIGKKQGEEIIFVANETYASEEAMLKSLKTTKEKIGNEPLKVKFTINGISRMLPHELNEELFKKVFPKNEVADEAAFNELIKKQIEDSFLQEADKFLLNEASETLVKNLDVELPEDFLKRWFFNQNEGKLTLEQIENEWSEKYLPSIKWQLIEEEINKAEKVTVEKDDIKAFLRSYVTSQFYSRAEQDDNDAIDRIVDSMMENKEQVKQIYTELYDKKLIEVVKNLITVNPKAVSKDEFIRILTGK